MKNATMLIELKAKFQLYFRTGGNAVNKDQGQDSGFRIQAKPSLPELPEEDVFLFLQMEKNLGNVCDIKLFHALFFFSESTTKQKY